MWHFCCLPLPHVLFCDTVAPPLKYHVLFEWPFRHETNLKQHSRPLLWPPDSINQLVFSKLQEFHPNISPRSLVTAQMGWYEPSPSIVRKRWTLSTPTCTRPFRGHWTTSPTPPRSLSLQVLTCTLITNVNFKIVEPAPAIMFLSIKTSNCRHKIIILEQGCTTQISWRAKFFFWHIQGPKLICFNTFKGCFYKRKKQNKQNSGFRGPD